MAELTPLSPHEAPLVNATSLGRRLKIGLACRATKELRKLISDASYSLDNNLHIIQLFTSVVAS